MWEMSESAMEKFYVQEYCDFLPITYTRNNLGLLENLNQVCVSRITRMSVYILSQSMSNRSIYFM